MATYHEYSKLFKKSTDREYKDGEFEKQLAEYIIGFVQCYPHVIEKYDVPHLPGEEMWVFKFWCENPDREDDLAGIPRDNHNFRDDK